MILKQNNIYIILTITCFLGYAWVGYNLMNSTTNDTPIQVCLIKKTTTIPCQACGVTRSIISFINGDFSKALYINPLGFLIVIIMILLPFWIILDLVTKKNTLFKFYKKLEMFLQKKKILILLILFVIINWGWNIMKGL